MNDEQSIEDLAEEIMEIAVRTNRGIWAVNAKEQILKLLQSWQSISKNWLPTSENINALPEPVRRFIHDIETNADPPSMVADNIILRDTVKALEIKLEEFKNG